MPESHGADPERAFYESVKDYEHHFNEMMWGARKLASAWLLVAFAALAYVARGELKAGALLQASPTISTICLLAAIGLLVLYILDILVYRGLLNAAFNLALSIETRRGDVPPLRSVMMATAQDTGMGGLQIWFYRAPLIALALISSASGLIPGVVDGPSAHAGWLLLPALSWLLVAFEASVYRQGERRKLALLVDLGVIPASAEAEQRRNAGVALSDADLRDAARRLQAQMRRNLLRWGRRE